MRFIGGFFELELPPPRGERTVADMWEVPRHPEQTFANARSAFDGLLRSVRPGKLWLPAYLCNSMYMAAAGTGIAVEWYPVGPSLEPDVLFIEERVASGEMVMAIDYFGRAPSLIFRDFVRSRPDVFFLEDAAQAFDTCQPRWGTWRLHSPRKLMGVPDGGFLVPSPTFEYRSKTHHLSDVASYKAASLRFEDEANLANAHWHAANQAREASECIRDAQMSRLSRTLLQQLPADAIARRRFANFAQLGQILGKISFLDPNALSFVPFGFPIRLAPEARSRVRETLLAKQIFPAVHWSDLPAPPGFAAEHALSHEMLTLPCDQRYEASDMTRIADIVLTSLSKV